MYSIVCVYIIIVPGNACAPIRRLLIESMEGRSARKWKFLIYDIGGAGYNYNFHLFFVAIIL